VSALKNKSSPAKSLLLFVGLELIKLARSQQQRTTVLYWRDLAGPEVDWVLQTPELLIPIEVKLTDKPRLNDAKHLETFMKEYDEAQQGYIICQAPRKMKLSENIYAIPWQSIFSHNFFKF